MHDSNVERNAICSIVNQFGSAQELIYAMRVTADHFHMEPYKIMFEAIMDLAQDSKPVNFETLWLEISVKGSFVEQNDVFAVEACKQDRPEYWLDLLHKYYIAQKADVILRRAGSQLKNPQNIADIVSSSAEELFHLQVEIAKTDETIKVEDCIDNVGLIKSKYSSINDVTIGVPCGRPVVIGARPGIGKTTYGCCEVLDKIIIPDGNGWYTYGVHATIFSLEMTRTELIRKMTCILSNVPESTVRRKMMTPDQQSTFTKFFNLIVGAPLNIYDKPHTPKQVCGNMRWQAEKNNTKFVMLDYFQRLRSKFKKDRQFYSDGSNDIADSLKGLISEPTMLIFSQLNREADMDLSLSPGRRNIPKMSHLKETGALEEDAYQIGLLYPDPQFAHNNMDDQPIILKWGKNRGGRIGESKMIFLKQKGRFRDAGL